MQYPQGDFYKDYSDEYKDLEPDNTQQGRAEHFYNSSKRLAKRQFILMLLLVFPITVFIGLLIKIIIMIPSLTFIANAVKGFLASFFYPVSIISGIIISYKAVQRSSVMGDDDDHPVTEKHTVFLIVCELMCYLTAEFRDMSWTILIPFIISILLTIFSFRFYTPLEKKLFTSMMIISVVSSMAVQIPNIMYTFSPVYNLNYETDYYFVSKEAITPKNQTAKYYIDENIPYDMVFSSYGAINDHESLQSDVIEVENPYDYHSFECDSEIRDILRDIVKDNLQKYDESFFENNFLMIIPIQYGNNTERVDISKITLKNRSITIFHDIYESTESDAVAPNEFCFAFIGLSKNQNMEWENENINNYSIGMEQNNIESSELQ